METAPGPPALTTERLRLRPLGPADVDPLFEIYSDPEAMRYWSSPPYEDRAQAEEMLARIERNFASGEVHVWGIERVDDGELLGTMTLMLEPGQPRAELGYMLGRPHWGRGYAAEAQRRVIDHAFGDLGLTRLEADTHPLNEASIRSLERLGFTREGTLRERWTVAGEVSDSAIFGLLAREWS